MSSVGDRIREVRQVLDMSQRELASSLGVRQATVSGWETGRDNPTPGNLRLLADLLVDSRAVYRWLQGEGAQPRLRPYDPETDHTLRPAESYGFLDTWDLSEQIEMVKQLVSRAETSTRLGDELYQSLPDGSRRMESLGRSIRMVQECTRHAAEDLRYILEVVERHHRNGDPG